MSASQERTEEATPKRRQALRARGMSARSLLTAPALSVCAAALPALAFVASARGWLQSLMHSAAGVADPILCCDSAALLALARLILVSSTAAIPIAVALLTAILVALGAAFATGSLGFAPQALAPNLGRLASARRIVNVDNLVLVAAGALSAACVLAATIAVAAKWIVTASSSGSVLGAASAIDVGVITIWWRAAVILGVLACVELFVARRRFAKSIRMTPRELQEERAETEARPEAKQRRRSAGVARARNLRISAIAKATAVVANPTHIAVALRYAPLELDVPTVVARGADLRAAIVKAAARIFDVPIIEAPELARALYSSVEVDEPIPEECYAAVAAVFAWIVRTRGSLRPDAGS